MLIFYFSANNNSPGGVQSLILNVTRYMSSIGQKVKIIDRKDGYVYINATKEDLSFVFIDNEKSDWINSLDKNDVLICFGHFERDLKLFKKNKIKVLYWSVFPDEIINFLKIRTSLKKNKFSNNNIISKYYTNKLISILSEKNALVAMEQSHIDVIREYYKGSESINYSIVPVPIIVPDKITKAQRLFTEKLSVAYIGRDEVWKIQPFIKLIQDLTKQKSYNTIIVHVYTNNSKGYKALLKQYNVKIKDLMQIIYHEGLYSDRLTEHIINNIDVLFAMGTSILEGSKLGIPTIILDPSYEVMPRNYKYRWLFEESGFSLGLPLWLIQNRKGKSLDKVLCDIDNNYLELSSRNYYYTKYNHSIESVCKKIIDAASKTDLMIDDLSWMRNLFTVKRKIYHLLSMLTFKRKG